MNEEELIKVSNHQQSKKFTLIILDEDEEKRHYKVMKRFEDFGPVFLLDSTTKEAPIFCPSDIFDNYLNSIKRKRIFSLN